MAVRVLTYLGLLYQDLIKAQKIPRDGLLPDVLPMVLYNGPARWRAATKVSALLCDSSDGLAQYRPELRYLLIDEGAYDDQRLAIDGNLVAILFRLENCFQRHRVEALVTALVGQLKAAELHSLRRAFAVWLDRVIFTRFAGARSDPINEAWETEAMLAERVPIWEQELRDEGRQQLLLGLMRKRFGELPDAVQARLKGGTSEQIARWAERLLEGKSLAELFGTEVAS